jgi:hypothetical protein
VGVGFVDAPSVSAEFALCNEDTGMEAGEGGGVCEGGGGGIVRDNKARLNAVVREGSLFLFIVTSFL